MIEFKKGAVVDGKLLSNAFSIVNFHWPLNTANGIMRAATMQQRALKRKHVHDEVIQHNDALKVSALSWSDTLLI